MIMHETYPEVTIHLEVVDDLCWFSWIPSFGVPGHWFSLSCASLGHTAGAFNALTATADFNTSDILEGEIADYLFG